MSKSLGEIAKLIDGKLIGDPDVMIYGATNLEDAGEQQITFAVAPYLDKAQKSFAAAFILPSDIETTFSKPVILVDNPRVAFAKVLEMFSPLLEVKKEIHSSAFVASSAKIGKNVAIMPYAFVDEDCVIGDGVIIYPHVYIGRGTKVGSGSIFYSNVSIYANCQIGDRVILHSGAVIGGDGFGYVTIEGKHRKVPQVGNVVLGDDVEIGCNSCVDCGTTGSTFIGNGTKIDNLVHVAHNDIIGENCFLVAHVGISGSVKVGNNVTMAGQVATSGHITIGDNCVFAGRSGITRDVPSNSVYAGFPARPHKEWLKQEVMQRKLPEMFKKLNELEMKLKKLEDK